jgi:hypothetical protein
MQIIKHPIDGVLAYNPINGFYFYHHLLIDHNAHNNDILFFSEKLEITEQLDCGDLTLQCCLNQHGLEVVEFETWDQNLVHVDWSWIVGKVVSSIVKLDDHKGLEINVKGCGAFRLKHLQECCEQVWLDDVCGDLTDLIESQILKAELTVNINNRGTWSFYHIATMKGHVTLRFCGTSTGCYSTTVDFYKLT